MPECNLLSYENWLIDCKDQIDSHIKANPDYDSTDIKTAYYQQYISWYKGAHLEEFPELFNEYVKTWNHEYEGAYYA